MEDETILAAYFSRDERAISQTTEKYGAFCYRIALNILGDPEDAQECVNDALLRAWNAIPPQKPEHLGAWLGRVVRNAAYDLWRKNHRQKRGAGMETILQELEECIPAPAGVERTLAGRELTQAINAWLAALPKGDRVLFVRRYWYGEPPRALAKRAGMSPRALTRRMYRLRQSLRRALEKEDCFP